MDMIRSSTGVVTPSHIYKAIPPEWDISDFHRELKSMNDLILRGTLRFEDRMVPFSYRPDSSTRIIQYQYTY